MPNHTIQDRPLSSEDLTPYRGRWVVLRDGRIIADGDSPEELRASEEVKQSDIVVLIPEISTNAVFL